MFGKMKLENLQGLYVDELQDVYDAEQQLVEALPKMEKAATAPDLRSAFRGHLEETEGQISRLEECFRELGVSPKRKTCKGMKGIIAEGAEYVEAKGDPDTIDASLIAAAQRVEHYEIAVYGTLRNYARVLGLRDQEALLDVSLDQEKRADQKLTSLAERGINVAAAV